MPREMKDSGIEWIGEIPSHWERTKLLNLLRSRICDGPHETPNLIDDGIPFISVDSLNTTERIDLNKCKKFISEEDYFRYKEKANLEEGDILFTKAATIGKTAIVGKEIFMVWSPIAIIKTNTNMTINKYVYHLLNCSDLIKYISLLGSYNTQINVGMRELEQAIVPLPPIEEQQAIADLLDTKCAEIDAVVEQTKATIEEYKKLKQSVITEAVTKGIRGDRPMNDSGIEWIGEICEEYSIYRLKHLLQKPLMYGANESGAPFDESLPRYIRITDITLDGKLKDFGKLSLTEESASEYILEDNDVLFARSGATVGKAFIYRSEYGKSAFAGYLIKASVNQSVLADYLFLYTQSSLYEEWKKQIFVQATIQNIGADRYSNLPIVLPSIKEQHDIVSYLDQKCAEIDTLIEKKTALLAEMETYKKSLIFEYVTGKKEVV